MRGLIIFMFFLFYTFGAKAQINDNSLYGNLGFSVGTHINGEYGVNYIYKNKYSLYIGNHFYSQRSPDRPSDFSGGIFSIFGVGHDRYEDIQVLVGKIIPSENNNTRVNIRAGLAFTKVNKVVDFVYAPTLLGPNYTFNRHQFNTVSLVINPVFEMIKSRVLGLYLSSAIEVNKETVFFGVGFGITAGILRAKKKNNGIF